MEVICLEEKAFYALIEEVYDRLKEREKVRDKWVDRDEALRLLRIKSKTTLQKLRDTGKIRFTQPEPQTILYDTDSIDQYLENHANETF
ncbi:MAG: helix-turn-helix domain-containing protein [Owenweeksia sp.]